MQRTEGAGGEVKVLFPDEAKDFIDSHREGTYTLLDVRQPVEYEESHLPGARLIPLPELVSTIDELDPALSTIVYCAVGGRSHSAAQFLVHRGFKDVYHLQGGIEAWEQTTASGPEGFHWAFVKGDETPEEIIRLAYRMEDGLKRFHEMMREKTRNPDLAELLLHLAKADESHKQTLLGLLEEHKGSLNPDELGSGPPLIEGGVDMDEFMSTNGEFIQTLDGYLDVAMMIETQALDLYLRMAGVSSNPEGKRVLLKIADEEKIHLNMLGSYLERVHGPHSTR